MSIQPLVDHFLDTEVGHHIRRIGTDEGIQKGIEKGIAQEKERMLQVALEVRFGENSDATAAAVQRLSNWTEVEAISTIMSAPDLQTLLTAAAPARARPTTIPEPMTSQPG
jgi:hypothetical protein